MAIPISVQITCTPTSYTRDNAPLFVAVLAVPVLVEEEVGAGVEVAAEGQFAKLLRGHRCLQRYRQHFDTFCCYAKKYQNILRIQHNLMSESDWHRYLFN